jgi:hypothetical protein
MNEAAFFDDLRKGLLGPVLTTSEVEGCKAILAATVGLPLSYCADAFATAYKETGHTMLPIRELGGDKYFFRRYDPAGLNPRVAKDLGNTKPGDGVRFHGRGYVQLTGRRNYALADAKLAAAGLIKPGELMANPDLAMRPDIAAFIMRRGMVDGWFTGRKFSTYLPPAGPATGEQFRQARRIINGLDCADEIAAYARQFQSYLQRAGY